MALMLQNEEREGIVTTIYPVVNGNGANYIAMNLAYAMRTKDEHARIAVVDFDFENPYLGLGLHDDNIHGIDNLIDKINGGFLDKEMFEENMIVLKENVHLLAGTKMGRFYNMVRYEHLETIIKFLRERYEYIFISTNASPEDGGTAQALYHAQNVLVVGQYNNKNLIIAPKAAQTVKNLTRAERVGVLYNFFNGQNGLDYSDSFGVWPVLGTIPYLVDTIDNHNLIGRGLQIVKRNRKEESSETYSNVLNHFNM